MKRFLLLLAVFFMVISATFSQALYEDDFESYSVGDYIAVENPEWFTTWSGTTGGGEDALISDDYAHSGSNSVLVDEVGGPTDLLLLLGDKTSGVYDVNFWMYIPSGSSGYYNFQHFEAPGNEWAIEVYLNADGTADDHAGGANAAAFTYDHDSWIEFAHNINLTDDWAEYYVDGSLIHEWQWSLQAQGEPGTNQLGGIDFFANTGNVYYFDDVTYEEIQMALYDDDFESYSVGDYIAVENPEWWTTWANAPGTGEDALISDDQAHSGNNSVLVDEVGGATDLILKLGDKTSGVFAVSWWMYVPAGAAGYYNFQHFEAPGNEWAIEVYLNLDGTADVHAGGANEIGRASGRERGKKLAHDINVTDDWAEYYVEGSLIHEWQWSLQA
ncbi:MAG: hypothetical protein K8R68_06290, partial [Bacteroidales bacterium]|nr:hypothetical protein [Bacteroidales bacterium]